MRETCASCKFWFRSYSQCRRHAPIGIAEHVWPDGKWPTVTGICWCGDYRTATERLTEFDLAPTAQAQP